MTQKNPDTKSVSFDSSTVQIGRLAKSLPELVAEQVLTAINDGALEPGERLKEEVLAERFAVSRSTIREAIAFLERRGVVERVPRYGARVVVIDAAEVEEIFNIRAQLLGLAARYTAEFGSDEALAEFERQVVTLEQLAAKQETEPGDYASASIEAQRILISTANRKRLRAIYDDLSNAALWQFAIRSRAISFQTAERRKESSEDWRRVANAVARRDGAAAEQAAKALLQASLIAVKSQIGTA